MARHYLKKLNKDLFGDDRKALLPLPKVAFDESKIKAVRNNYAKFTLNEGAYLLHRSKYAKSKLFMKMTAHEVSF